MKKLSILCVWITALTLSACSLTPKAPETVVDTGSMMTGDMMMTWDAMMMTGDMMTGMNMTWDAMMMTGDEMMMTGDGVLVWGAMMVKSKDIVDNAVMSTDHTTLVAAVKAAWLVDVLKWAWPFTVFAPTNEAFAKLPTWTVDTLLKPENKSKLVKVLTYHVIAGKYTTSDLKDGMKLKTVQWEELTITIKDGKTMVNWANVQIADILSSNWVTFVVDTVLLPKN